MGVPKFFRWLSERYPAISQLIAENRIPEFDNLYVGTHAGAVAQSVAMRKVNPRPVWTIY
jgi:5'-3' exonuclease